MTESLARISAQRPWVTIGVWLVLLVIALALIQNLLGSATTTDFRLFGRYESERAAALLEDKLRGPEKLAEIVIVQSPSLTVDDGAFRAKVEALHEDIVSLGPGTISGGIDGQPLFHYYHAIDAGPLIAPEQMAQLRPLLVSPDEKTALIHYTLAGTSQEATANVEEVVHKVEEANEADDFRVLIGGDASVAFENNELARHDLEKGERFGVPVAMFPPLSSFGVVGWFRLQQRYGHILSKLSPGRRQDSNFARFTSLLDTSLFDEEGIRYTLPDHVYAEESAKW